MSILMKLRSLLDSFLVWDWFHFPRTKSIGAMTDLLYKNEHFSSTVSRERFESILRFFNFGEEPMFDNDRLSKIRRITEHFNKTMLELIAPEKNLSIESMMLWRGRLIFRINAINMEWSFMNFVPTMDWSFQQRYMVVKVSMTLKTQVKLQIFRQFLWRNSCPQKELTLQALSDRTEKKPLESHPNEANKRAKGFGNRREIWSLQSGKISETS